ncbi:MAG: DUF5009 domain-containing protein [Kiritimatiellae bacterium]|nr:DUF5009 domain-containing protein [Kiritimatiellia bacterium]
MNTETKTGGRLGSLDALRGFDMFFITGGAAAIAGAAAACGSPDGWLAVQMRHVEWAGLAHHDTIFPLFLFLAGVSWPLSLASRRARGLSTLQIQAKIALRTVVLFLLGLSFGGILKFDPGFRLAGVLQFIGLSWGVAATCSLHVRRKGALALVAAALLAGYGCLLHFFAAPGAPADAWTYSVEWNIVSWLDKAVYGAHMVAGWGYEPESFFSLPSGVALALIGMLAGDCLKDGVASRGRRTVLMLALAGVAALALTCVLVWGCGVPVVKKLWTVTFVLAAASYSLLMLALFVYVVDVLALRRWTFLFDCVGKNSILAYMLMMTGVSSVLQRYLFTGLCEATGAWQKAFAGLTSYLVVWGLLRYLGRKGVYLRA